MNDISTSSTSHFVLRPTSNFFSGFGRLTAKNTDLPSTYKALKEPLNAMSTGTVGVGGFGEPDISYGPRLLTATLVLTVAAFVSVTARMWVRKILIKSVGWDDYFICAAMVSSLQRSAKTACGR